MQEHDGDRPPPALARAREIRAQTRLIEGHEHASVSIDALARLDDFAYSRCGSTMCAGKNIRPVLVADAQPVGEPLGRDQHHRLAAAREQRVGGDRGTDLHCFN